MRFAHLADCHIGSWRDPKLKDVSTKAFLKAIETCKEKEVDFILIAGDLFNTALPSIDLLKDVVEKFRELKELYVPVYLIAGSHDYSPSGKSMLEVLDKAGLIIDVSKEEEVGDKIRLNFTTDEKTGAKITGLSGKKGGLDKDKYELLIKKELEKEDGFKIFMFHNLLSEFQPEELKEMDSVPLKSLPKDFNYYAGGHPHIVAEKDIKDYGHIAYPGPLFPNSFAEIEKLGKGGFYIVNIEDINIDGKKDQLISIKWEPIQIFNSFSIKIDANDKTPEQVVEDIKDKIKGKEFTNTIVTIRAEGTLKTGKPADVDFKSIFDKLYLKSAHTIMKNTSKLSSKEFKEISVEAASVDDIEKSLIKEHLDQIKVDELTPEKEERLTKELMHIFSREKQEGETTSTFEDRIRSEIGKILKL